MTSRIVKSFAHAALALGLVVSAPVAPLAAQSTFDRTVAPKPPASPKLRVPSWTKTKLANGADLIVVEKHDLPLVALNIDFVGGAANYESADKLGVAQFAGQMLSEGTKTKTADQLSDEIGRAHV